MFALLIFVHCLLTPCYLIMKIDKAFNVTYFLDSISMSQIFFLAAY